ncbi:N-6 DNA methylase [Aeromonas veronii]
MTTNISSLANHIWSVADLLRGDFKQSQYGRIILPFTVLRRLECMLAPTRELLLAMAERTKGMSELTRHKQLLISSGQSFYNTSSLTLNHLGEMHVNDNLNAYIRGFSHEAFEIFEHFHFTASIDLLDDAGLLYKVVRSFSNVDLSPDAVDNYHMGLVFDELVRKFAESSNETAGEHFTPRDIVHLTTALVFAADEAILTTTERERTIYDPTCGTGGFLSSGMEYLHGLNPAARLTAFGQELNPESYAICRAGMLLKGQETSNIKLGNTLSDDQLPLDKFDYCLSNPPFGMDWKKVEKQVREEHQQKGNNGRFGVGLPRISDGSLLFLQHLVAKMKPTNHEGLGARIGIILNGSSLFAGGAGSGESEIRRYILENDLLDTLVALPTDMFYNTGIATYIWVLSNHKPAERKGRVLLINATGFDSPMRKSFGSKRKFINDDAIKDIVELASQFKESPITKIVPSTAFGYRRITVESPLKLAFYPQDLERLASLKADKRWAKLDEELQQVILKALASLPEQLLCHEQFKKQLTNVLGSVKLSSYLFKMLVSIFGEQCAEALVCKTKEELEASVELRDYENVPLGEDIHGYFKREVLPYVPDAWIDLKKTDPCDGNVGVVGYEINFSSYFQRSEKEYGSGFKKVKIKRLIEKTKSGEYILSPRGKIIPYEKSTGISTRFSVIKSKLDVDYYNAYAESDDGIDWLSAGKKYRSDSPVLFNDWFNFSLGVPSLKEQMESLELYKQCNLLLNKIAMVRGNIFVDLKSAKDELSIYNNLSNRFDDEFSSLLPTPLAILWVIVESKKTAHEKCEAYIKFFECLSYYFLSIVTGANERALHEFIQRFKRLKSISMAFPYNVFEQLKKKGVELDPIFHTLTSDESVEVLKRATTLRNDIAHRGLPSEKIARDTLSTCEKIMSDIVSLHRGFFESTRLVRVGRMQFNGDFYSCDVEVAKGLALNPCKTDTVSSSFPLVCGDLYITEDTGEVNIEQKHIKITQVMVCDEISDGSGLLGFYFLSDVYEDVSGDEKTCKKSFRYFCPYPNVISVKIKEGNQHWIVQ